MDLSAEVIASGDLVTTQGSLVPIGNVLKLAPVIPSESGEPQVSKEDAVELLGPLTETDYPAGSLVIVTGEWTDPGIIVSKMDEAQGTNLGFRFPSSIGTKVNLNLPDEPDTDLSNVDQHQLRSILNELTENESLLHYFLMNKAGKQYAIASASDPYTVESKLRPLLGSGLVVVRNNWTRADLSAVGETLSQSAATAGLMMTGEGLDSTGRYRANAWVLRMTQNLSDHLSHFPKEILDYDVWLKKSHTGKPS